MALDPLGDVGEESRVERVGKLIPAQVRRGKDRLFDNADILVDRPVPDHAETIPYAVAAEILEEKFENESISLTGRERMTTREMLDMINEIMGGDIKLNVQVDTTEGHYVQTPYNYTPKLGKKMARETYIDLGLGLLDCLQDLDKNRGTGD